jgi:hypothetical protein
MNRMLLVLVLAAAGSNAQAQTVTLIEEVAVEGFARVNGMPFTGISGFDYDPQSGRAIAVSNDTGRIGPVRFFGLKLDFSDRGLGGFVPDQAQALNHPDGTRFEPGLHQPGAVRIIPADPIGDEPYLVWTSEGHLRDGKRAGVFEMCTGATFMDWFRTGDASDQTSESSGPRHDLAWESLALMPDHSLIAACEQPLTQDGPVMTAGSGAGTIRLVHLDYWTAKAIREYAYPIAEPGPDAPEGAVRSLVELIAVDQDTLLSIESVMVPDQGRSPRATTELYMVELAGATDVTVTASLAESSSFTPVAKRLIADTASLGIKDLRYNAGAFWHKIDNNRFGLVLVTDNGNDQYRPTYFALLGVEGLEPMRPYVRNSAGRHAPVPGPDASEPRVIAKAGS